MRDIIFIFPIILTFFSYFALALIHNYPPTITILALTLFLTVFYTAYFILLGTSFLYGLTPVVSIRSGNLCIYTTNTPGDWPREEHLDTRDPADPWGETNRPWETTTNPHDADPSNVLG